MLKRIEYGLHYSRKLRKLHKKKNLREQGGDKILIFCYPCGLLAILDQSNQITKLSSVFDTCGKLKLIGLV